MGSCNCKFDRRKHLCANFFVDCLQRGGIEKFFSDQPAGENGNRIAIGFPLLLFLLRTVIFTTNVAHVVAGVAVGVAQQQRWPFAAPRAFHQARSYFMDGTYILTIDTLCVHAKCRATLKNIASRGFRKMGVLGIEIVFAYVDDRQLPKRRQIHHFIEHSLAQRAFTKKAHRNLGGLKMFCRESRSGGDPGAPRDDRVCSQISRFRIRNVHRPALALAISRFLAEQLREHSIRRSALGHTVPVSAVGAGDVIVRPERFADSDCYGFSTNVEMRQAGHQCPGIKLVHLFFKQANHLHSPVHLKIFISARVRTSFFLRALVCRGFHRFTPLMLARTSNTTAKSSSTRPMPRAEVRNSLVIAVVGIGTSRYRPSSSASRAHSVVTFTLNHASSGSFRTKGPRYFTIGEAIALFTSTSTATSRAIPLFSARKTPSENASICTAKLKLHAILITRARPLSPTYVTLGPTSCSRPAMRSKVSFRPPTITESFPSCRVT